MVLTAQNPEPKPKALVLYGYGLNCDWETQFALNKAGAEAVRVHTSDLLANPAMLWDYHLLAVPGGFSWGDEHGAGVILALRLKLASGHDGVRLHLVKHRGGAPVVLPFETLLSS